MKDESIFNPGQRNADIQKSLEELPSEVSAFLLEWRKATLDREKTEALLYLKFRGENPDRTATEIKALVNSNDERYQVSLKEAQAEAQYTKVLETLLCAKKEASLRTAF